MTKVERKPTVELTKELLTAKETCYSAIQTLGGLATNQLLRFGQVGFYLNPAGIVEMAPLVELTLNHLPEEDAIAALLKREYTNEKIKGYLAGRDARLANLKG